jgi:hypothetical protein
MGSVPMLADFGVRLAFGLTVALLGTSWRVVPLRFFRFQNLVILGVLVRAGLDQARVDGAAGSFWLVVAGAILAHAATVSWGLGLPQFGRAAGILAALATAAWMVDASHSVPVGLWTHTALSRGASGFLMGATLTAMLLGHYYLIAPTLAIDPLQRSVTMIALGLAARCMLASIAVWIWRVDAFGMGTTQRPVAGALLAARWGIGFAGAAVSVYLTRRTVLIRSTQSATGILYITTIFVIFGELTSLIDSASGRIC